MEPTKQLSNQRNNQRTNLPTYLPSRERCASLFARLIWPSARPQLVPRFHGRFSQIYAGLRFPRVTFSPPVIPPPPTDSFFSLGLTVCALNLCVLYMHFDSFVRTHVCIHVSTGGRVREKANRPVRNRCSSRELGSARLSTVREAPIWRTISFVVACFVAEDFVL